MPTDPRIKIIIVDDDQHAIFSLQGFLELIPIVNLVGFATTYPKALKLIKEHQPDLLFLDIEMPGKTGFELLAELEKQGVSRTFKVIFHTAYDKYTVQALREAAFDFLLKPAKEIEIKETIERFMKSRNATTPMLCVKDTWRKLSAQYVALPTVRGLQFHPINDIAFVEYQKNDCGPRSIWVIHLNNGCTIKLKPNTTATDILNHFGSDSFVSISQTVIVNLSYIYLVEYKSNHCYLFPPFDGKPLHISRQYMMALRDRFEMI